MKSIIQKIKQQNKQLEQREADAKRAELNNPGTSYQRRDFLKKSLLGGVSLAGMMSLSIEDTVAQTTANVSLLPN